MKLMQLKPRRQETKDNEEYGKLIASTGIAEEVADKVPVPSIWTNSQEEWPTEPFLSSLFAR